MITVSITEKHSQCKIRIRGHSGASPRGEDLICAAASALAFSAAEVFSRYERDGDIFDLRIDFEPGKMDIGFRTSERKESVAGALSAIKCGIEVLSEKFPQNLTLIYGQRAI